LEHSSSALTNKIYTNVDPVLRQSVDQLPIEQWLLKQGSSFLDFSFNAVAYQGKQVLKQALI